MSEQAADTKLMQLQQEQLLLNGSTVYTSSEYGHTATSKTYSDEQQTPQPVQNDEENKKPVGRTASQVELLVQRKWFIQALDGDIRQRYEFEERIGAGAFGAVYRVRDPQDGRAYAVKSVLKTRMQELQVFINEINMLRDLDHPNVLQLYEIWETDEICSIVSEYLPHGDLLQYCNKNVLPFAESQACIIIRQLFRALRYLHNKNVVHADVKLENCLFGGEELESLHLVDFGLSMNIRNISEIQDGIRGTLNYMAPELLLADRSRALMPQLTDRTDVWAAGVILYTMCVGVMPFNGTTQQEVIQQMTASEDQIRARLTSNPQWLRLSDYLKDLILGLLRVNPVDRITSSQALKHPWITYGRNQELRNQNMLVGIADLKAMAVYGKKPVLKKLTLMYVAVRLDDTSCKEIEQKFKEADRDENGIISPDEFNQIFQKATGDEQVPMRSTDMLFDMMDTNRNQQIEFSEFKAAMLKTTLHLHTAQLGKAFRFFDRDNSGQITKDELTAIFSTFEDLFNMFDETDFEKIIAQADLNQDGKLSYEEFVAFMTQEYENELYYI